LKPDRRAVVSCQHAGRAPPGADRPGFHPGKDRAGCLPLRHPVNRNQPLKQIRPRIKQGGAVSLRVSYLRISFLRISYQCV
jgi:hypothetical protein